MGSFAQRHLKNDGDKMAFRPVILANKALRPCASHIEITQDNRAYTVRPAHPVHHALHGELAFAIGIGGPQWRVLGNGNDIRFAIDRSRGRKHDFVHPVARHGFKQHHHAMHVVLKIFERLFHALTHKGAGGKVQHGLNGLF